ncbi:hypothetical protein TNCV_1103451 [Trichonephila clavipes]|nr:hypothetical protein TNCV_1103451 [Trichonephila clavipes]
MGSMVAQRLTQITPPAATPDQLWKRVEAAWSAVPQEHIQSLFESMPRSASEKQVGRIDVSAATSVGAIKLLGVGNSGSQKVECTVAEGQDVPGTQMIARIVQSEDGHFGTNNVASIDSTPLTSFQTSSAIKRNHKGDDFGLNVR